MKTKLLIILALLSGAVYAEDKVLLVQPGDRVFIHGDAIASKADVLFDKIEARDVVKALTILLKYAPNKYGTPRGEPITSLSTSTGTIAWSATVTSWNTSTPSKAEKLRKEAEGKLDAAKELRAEADKADKEQEEIEWAVGVLEKWKRKVAELK